MVLPRTLARINRRLTNPILAAIPRRWSPFVLLHHTGRDSGRRYTTPLAAFESPDGIVLTPTYGPDADWVRNILSAQEFSLDRRGEERRFGNARLVARTGAWSHLPILVRIAMRLLRVETFVAADEI